MKKKIFRRREIVRKMREHDEEKRKEANEEGKNDGVMRQWEGRGKGGRGICSERFTI